jgi:hypothetical protein
MKVTDSEFSALVGDRTASLNVFKVRARQGVMSTRRVKGDIVSTPTQRNSTTR